MADPCASILRPRRCLCLPPASFERPVSDRPPRRPLCDCFEHAQNLYLLYTGAATFLPPLCDHKTGQVAVEGRKEAERLPWSLNGGTQDVQTSPWTPWSPWSFGHVQNSRTKVAEEVGRSQVARMRQEEGTHIAMVAEWMHSGRPLVAPLKLRTVVNIVYQLEQRFCLPCTTIVPPLADR